MLYNLSVQYHNLCRVLYFLVLSGIDIAFVQYCTECAKMFISTALFPAI